MGTQIHANDCVKYAMYFNVAKFLRGTVQWSAARSNTWKIKYFLCNFEWYGSDLQFELIKCL